MNIHLNGKKLEIPNGTFLLDLIKSKKLNPDNIIALINEEIIKSQEFNTFLLTNNSRVEILSIVGGG